MVVLWNVYRVSKCVLLYSGRMVIFTKSLEFWLFTIQMSRAVLASNVNCNCCVKFHTEVACLKFMLDVYLGCVY